MLSWELVRFIPGFGPGTPFRFTEGFAGGARRLLAAAAVGVAAALESDAFGAGDATAFGSDGVGPEMLDEADFACAGDESEELEGHLAKSSELRRRVTILLLVGREENLEVMARAAGGMVVVELAI
jgi:hypothetical protein